MAGYFPPSPKINSSKTSATRLKTKQAHDVFEESGSQGLQAIELGAETKREAIAVARRIFDGFNRIAQTLENEILQLNRPARPTLVEEHP